MEESVFGKLKTLEGDQSSSGFTRYVLSLGALVGDWSTTRIKQALEKTPVKAVQAFVQYQLAAQKMQPNRFVCVAGYGDCGMGYIGGDRIDTDGGGYEQS